MNLRFACSAVVVITCGVASLAYAQRRDGNLLPPDKSEDMTIAGCLMSGDQVGRKGDDFYVLARPQVGLDSVPEATCTADFGADALEIEHAKKVGIDESMLGHWIEVSGKLERETSKNPDNLRELKATAFRMLPVVAPRVAAAPAPYRPPQIVEQPAPAPEPAIVATAGVEPSLPKTASQVPAIGLLGLLSLAGAVLVRSFRLRARD